MTKQNKKKVTLCIDRCPQHSRFWSIAIMRETGGKRITPSKCCGSWTEVTSWRINAELIRRIQSDFQSALDYLEADIPDPAELDQKGK